MNSKVEDLPKIRHLGHMFLDAMRRRPDAICQIDAATGEQETNSSVLTRSIRLARCLRNFGVQPGDVLSLGGRNHLNLHIPFYAALLNGLPVSGVDPFFKYDEIKSLFELTRPKVAFCQKEMYEDYLTAVKNLGLDTKIITFEDGEFSMEEFAVAYEKEGETNEDFKPAEFDSDKIYAFLVSTSGTTGGSKVAAIKFRVLINKINRYIAMTKVDDNKVNNITLSLSPVNWISGFFNAIGLPIMNHTKLQTSDPDNLDHIIYMINTYKPVSTLMSPSFISSLLSRKDDVDLTCFRMITVTGSKLHADTLAEFKARLHNDGIVIEAYGMVETIGPCLLPIPNGPAGCCGRPLPYNQLKLVDPDTGKEITGPNTPGELWVKGETFTEFYNDPDTTSETFTEDGYYKTGDLLYRNGMNLYFYVDRLKTLIKYRNAHILPVELEDVIRTHPSVRDVCVTAVPHPQDGQRPVACVVLREGGSVSAEEIKDLVASKLSINKQLTGGVVFLDALPMTSTGKIARAKLQDLVLNLPKQ